MGLGDNELGDNGVGDNGVGDRPLGDNDTESNWVFLEIILNLSIVPYQPDKFLGYKFSAYD